MRGRTQRRCRQRRPFSPANESTAPRRRAWWRAACILMRGFNQSVKKRDLQVAFWRPSRVFRAPRVRGAPLLSSPTSLPAWAQEPLALRRPWPRMTAATGTVRLSAPKVLHTCLSAPRHYPVDPWLARRQGILLIADGFPVSRIGAPAVYSSPRGEVPGPFKLVETSAFLFILLC